MHADPARRRIAAETLGELGTFATPARTTIVERSIADPEPPVRYALLAALERIGWEPDQYVEQFASLLDDPDQIVQARAAWALGRVGPAAGSAVPDLVRIAMDTSRLVDPRWSAVVALGRLGPVSDPAVPSLIALLGDADADMREASARAIGEISAESDAISALEAALTDPDQLVRDGAALGLGTIGPPAARAVPSLEELLGDDWPAVRAAACEALVRITGNLPPAVAHPGTRAELVVADQLPARLEGLSSSSERTRGISTFEIGKLGPGAAEAVPLLADLLAADHNLDVRWSAAWAFGKMGEGAAAAVPALARAVGVDPDPDVRAQAAWAIGRIAGERIDAAELAVEILRRALADPDSLVREEAAGALGHLGPQAVASVPDLARCTDDAHALVRRRALDAIRSIELDSQAD